MDSTNIIDIHSMISNDTLIKKLHKEELCTCLKKTKLNFTESSYIFQQIRSKYEIVDRLDIIHNLSIDFGEINNIEITKFLELFRTFGKCIEWDAFDSIVEIIESAFSRNKQNNNKNIKALKAANSYNFGQLYDIFNKIAEENDVEAMSFAINEKLHEKTFEYYQDIFSYSLEKSNFNLICSMIEYGVDFKQHFMLANNISNIKNSIYFSKIPHFDVNANDSNKNTALIYASENGHHEVVKLLLTVPGIDINAKGDNNDTALIRASTYGHHEVVKLLLTHPGIDINAKNNYNVTALIRASECGNHKIVKLFLAFPGIDVNAKNQTNRTALIRASINGHHKVVKLLLTHPRIDVNAKDKFNKTAMIMASEEGHHEVVKLLLTVPETKTALK